MTVSHALDEGESRFTESACASLRLRDTGPFSTNLRTFVPFTMKGWHQPHLLLINPSPVSLPFIRSVAQMCEGQRHQIP